jgi:hypothetical protein
MTATTTRRIVLGALAFGGLAPRALAQTAGPAPGRLSFVVLRNGQPMGTHVVDVTRAGDDLSAAIEAEFVIRIGPVPVFRYRHSGAEVWRGGRFASLRTSTVSNGKREAVFARREGAGVVIEGPAGRVASADAAPFTHWNAASLKSALFNPQTGSLLRVSVAGPQPGLARLADGATLRAMRYAVTGETEIADDYDASGDWTGLKGKGPDGSAIEYRRQA